MLSLSPVTNPTKAGSYFEADNYYAKNDPEAKSMSAWFGKGAETLGLTGEIEQKTFVELLNGKIPNGQHLGRLQEGKNEHRSGYDLTFSAPKSLSILLEIGEDSRLLAAHTKAVDAVLTKIEADLATCRVTRQGRTTIQKTGNLVIAKFVHDTSRALDPQLHTHAIVMNATQGVDGKFRSLASQSAHQVSKEGSQGFMERLYKHKIYYGTLYRAHLAFEVKALGYEINQTHKDGRFEIGGVPDTVIQHFSKRRQDIKTSLDLQGREGGKDAANATLFTRPDKQKVDRTLLDTRWKEGAKNLGFQAEKLVNQSIDKTSAQPVQNKETPAQEKEQSPLLTISQDKIDNQAAKIETFIQSTDDRNLRFNSQPTASSNWLSATKDWLIECFNKFLSSTLENAVKTLPFIQKTSLSPALGLPLSQEEKAQEAVVYAIAHLSERSSAFEIKELHEIATKHAFSNVCPDEIEKQIHLAKEQGILKEAIIDHEQWVTTSLSIQLEKDILASFDKGKNSLSPLMSTIKAENELRTFGLTEEQYKAGLLILTSQDRVVGIQGYAGTGKTSSLKATHELTRVAIHHNISLIPRILGLNRERGGEDIEIRGLTPSASAAKALQQSAGIPAQTLASFIYAKENDPPASTHKPAVWILDEASMVSSRQMLTIINLAEKYDAHLVLVGDTKQLLAVEAGQPFAQLQAHGMKTAYITEIKRQTNPTLLSSVKDSINGQIKAALSKVTNIYDIENTEERLKQMAQSYLALSPEARQETLVITPRRESRAIVNEEIRKGLIKEGTLAKKGYENIILTQDNLTQVEKGRTSNLFTGQILVFHTPYQGKGQEAKYWQIININQNAQTLELQQWGKTKQSTLHLANAELKNPFKEEQTKEQQTPKAINDSPYQTQSITSAFDVYYCEKRELRQGDTVRWTKNNKMFGMINGDTATLVKLGKRQATFKLSNQKTVKLDLREHQNKHWEYAYASTVYAAQGQTAQNVLAHEESYTRLTHQRAFYVILSRARESVTLFVDGINQYRARLEEATGNRLNALDVLKEANKENLSSVLKDSSPAQLDIKKQEERPANITPLIQQPKAPLKSELSNLSLADTSLPEKEDKPAQQQANAITKAKTYKPTFDKDEVRQIAHANLPFIVEKLLGQPNQALSKSTQWRYGKKGALSIQMEGKNKGMWHDFEGSKSKVSGDVFSLVQREMLLNFQEAIEIVGQWLGLSPKEREINPVKNTATLEILKAEKPTLNLPTEEDKSRINLAKEKFSKSIPINGTVAEKYLREHRGINIEKISESLAFIPAKFNRFDEKYYPALVVKAVNAKGEIQAVQLIYLDKKTGAKADIPTNKRQFGRMKFGAYATLQEGDNKRIMIAEGIETGLSIAEANPGKKVIASLSLSNLKNIVLPQETKDVILCADNDKGREAALKQLQPAISKLQAEGKEVYLAFPEWPKSNDKEAHALAQSEKLDFNDLHKQSGLEAVKAQTNTPEKLPSYVSKNIENPIMSIKGKEAIERIIQPITTPNPIEILFKENSPALPLPEPIKNQPVLDL